MTRIKEELFRCLFEEPGRLAAAPRPRAREVFLASRPVFAALAEEREQHWRRVAAADFLTQAEKRAALGLPPMVEG